jgi:hypothetical protein
VDDAADGRYGLIVPHGNEEHAPLIERALAYIRGLDWDAIDQYAGRYAALEDRNGPRRFFVSRLGGSGSTWLAKVLNAHPDVFCTHEGILSRLDPRQPVDIHEHFRFVERVASNAMHGAYAAIGDVGSTWVGQQHLFPPSWRSGFLIRHPVRTLDSLMSHVSAPNAVPEVAPDDRERIAAVFEVDCIDLDPLDLYFHHHAASWTCAMLHAYQLGGASVVLRLEQLSDLKTLARVLLYLTGVAYSDVILAPLLGARVNARESEDLPLHAIVSRFTNTQQRCIDQLAPAIAFAGYHSVA